MPRVPTLESFRLDGNAGSLLTPDEHRAAAARLRDEASGYGAAGAVLAALHSVLAEAIQLRIDEQCPPTAPP
jgi:hypothetical protein